MLCVHNIPGGQSQKSLKGQARREDKLNPLRLNLSPSFYLRMGGKKFALLLCAEDSDYVIKKYGGYYGVFVTMLGEEGETWDMFRVFNDEFPDHEEIKEFDGFVISGSCSDAHGNDSWILKLLNLVKQLDALKKKVLGICFGHQVIKKVQKFLSFSIPIYL